MSVKFPNYSKPTVVFSDDQELIRKFREAFANTKFKPPVRDWKLIWCRMKWYFYHVPRNWILILRNWILNR